MKLLAFAGRSGSGKDTCADMLPDYVNVKFAAPIKVMLVAYLEYMNVPSGAIDRMIDGDLKKVTYADFGGKTPQHAMQTLGDWFRGELDEDILLDCFNYKARSYNNVVCSDARKQNEVDLIKRMGGKTAMVIRDLEEYGNHATETEVDTLVVDFTIDNNDTLEYTAIQVEEFKGT